MTTDLKPIPLDEHERRALAQFLRLLAEEPFQTTPMVEEAHVKRGPDGQIIVPVTISGEAPSLSLALLMGHKAEHLLKQTGCRFVLAQRPDKDPEGKLYVRTEDAWHTV